MSYATILRQASQRVGAIRRIWTALPLSDHQRLNVLRYMYLYRIISVAFGRHTKPDFVVIGTQKGGTTSLFHYLTKHPHFREPLVKEIHFFDMNYHRGANWYSTFFPVRTGDNYVTADTTPYYMFHPEVPDRVAETLPDTTKFVVLLRNPVSRAYSHYMHALKHGHEDGRTFSEAIEHEINSLDSENSPLHVVNDPWSHRHLSYVSRGIYVVQLKRWFKIFPPERFFIIKSEDFSTRTEDLFFELLDFLGMSKKAYPTNHQFSKYFSGDYKSELDDTVRSRLLTFYKSYNQQLSELLNMDFTDWDSATF